MIYVSSFCAVPRERRHCSSRCCHCPLSVRHMYAPTRAGDEWLPRCLTNDPHARWPRWTQWGANKAAARERCSGAVSPLCVARVGLLAAFALMERASERAKLRGRNVREPHARAPPTTPGNDTGHLMKGLCHVRARKCHLIRVCTASLFRTPSDLSNTSTRRPSTGFPAVTLGLL